MNNKIKALIWEECRVGGVIALWCWLLGSGIMMSMKFENYVGVDDTYFLFGELRC